MNSRTELAFLRNAAGRIPQREMRKALEEAATHNPNCFRRLRGFGITLAIDYTATADWAMVALILDMLHELPEEHGTPWYAMSFFGFTLPKCLTELTVEQSRELIEVMGRDLADWRAGFDFEDNAFC